MNPPQDPNTNENPTTNNNAPEQPQPVVDTQPVIRPEAIMLQQRREIESRLRQILQVINPNTHTNNNTNNPAPLVHTDENAPADEDNTRLVNQTDAPQAENAPAPPATTTTQDENRMMSRDEIVSVAFRIIPLIVLPFLLFMYDHYIGVLVFVWFMWMLWSANERIKAQVALNESRSVILSASLMLLLGLQVALVIFVFLKMQLYLYFGMLAPPEKLDFYNSVFVVVIVDSMAKAANMLVKCSILLVTPCFLKTLTRSRLYSFTESIFATYRCLLPIPVWTQFMISGQYHLVFAGFVLAVYAIFKLRAFYECIKRSVISFLSLFKSSAQYGSYASTEEITELGDPNCSICHDEFNKPVRLDCGHCYCEECISSWFNTSNKTCPVCRQVCNDAVKLSHTDGGSSLGLTFL